MKNNLFQLDQLLKCMLRALKVPICNSYGNGNLFALIVTILDSCSTDCLSELVPVRTAQPGGQDGEKDSSGTINKVRLN